MVQLDFGVVLERWPELAWGTLGTIWLALAGMTLALVIGIAGVAVLRGKNRIGHAIGKAAGGSEWRTIAVVMPATAALAAFSHHLMVTAMMLPILMRLARDQKLAASRLLMPMSLAASLGTTLTLISAPAFLLANDLTGSKAG